jgi:hypothetical protein
MDNRAAYLLREMQIWGEGVDVDLDQVASKWGWTQIDMHQIAGYLEFAGHIKTSDNRSRAQLTRQGAAQ